MDEPRAEQKSTQDSNSPSPLKQIRTFQGDVASALQGQKESLYSIQQAERQKMAAGGSVASDIEKVEADAKKRERFFLFLLGSATLLALAGFIGWWSYREYEKKTAPPTIAVPESRFISAESDAFIDAKELTREGLFEAVGDESAGIGGTELKHLVLNASTTDFFKILESQAPGSLVRAFEPSFMLGTLGEDRFIIFKVVSFENAFAGQLLWEKDMAEDIGPLFSTAPILTGISAQSVFKDVVYRNKDVRVLYADWDHDGSTTTPPIAEPVMLYSFFDNTMLIITESFEALETLLERLTREKLSR